MKQDEALDLQTRIPVELPGAIATLQEVPVRGWPGKTVWKVQAVYLPKTTKERRMLLSKPSEWQSIRGMWKMLYQQKGA